MPISVLSAIRETSKHRITVKGGKFLEALAEADTIVFDKTGTLTKAKPVVADVIPFLGDDPDELLRTAACLENRASATPQNGQNAFFHCLIAFRSDVMLHLARIARRDHGIDAKMDQPVCQQGVAFIDAFRDFSSFIRQVEIPIF